MRGFDEIMERTRRNAMRYKKDDSRKQRKQIDLGSGMPVNGSHKRRYTHDLSEAIRRATEVKKYG